MSESEGLPIVPHLAGEFYTWLWFTSEQHGAAFDLPAPVGAIDLWVDERLAFRAAEETKVVAVMTGENPAASLEARAALAGGKVLQEIRVGLRREDREFFFTLKGPAMHVTALKLPSVVSEGAPGQGTEEALFERVHLYDEVCFVLTGLFRRFADVRASTEWQDTVLPALQQWILGRS